MGMHTCTVLRFTAAAAAAAMPAIRTATAVQRTVIISTLHIKPPAAQSARASSTLPLTGLLLLLPAMSSSGLCSGACG
jgi:hypothetical protein